MTGATRRTADAAAETAQRATDQGREAIVSGLRAVANAQGPLADAGFEQSRRALEITSRVTDVYRQAAERAADDVHALFDSWMSLGRGLQRWQQAYADALRQSLESVADKRQNMLQSDSPVHFAEVQRDLYVDLVSNTVQASTRLLELTGQIVPRSRSLLLTGRRGSDHGFQGKACVPRGKGGRLGGLDDGHGLRLGLDQGGFPSRSELLSDAEQVAQVLRRGVPRSPEGDSKSAR